MTSDKREKQVLKMGLRAKLVRMILVALGVSAGAILCAVAVMQVRTSQRSLRNIESQIHGSIEDKGRVLAKNHAIALRGLVIDNAFTAMNELVSQAVDDDPDLIYGLFLSVDGDAWAYHSPQTQADPDKPKAKQDPKAFEVLGIQAADKSLNGLTATQRKVFGASVLEFAMPVLDGEELLGTIRYGVSTARMEAALEEARAFSSEALERTLTILAAIVLLTTIVMVIASSQSATKITRPLETLSAAAQELAAGNRQVRVNIDSGDELQLLGSSFNDMVADLKSSYEQLEALNRDLEQRVEERTRELSDRNEAMRVVLDNVDQGLATIEPSGTLSSERSRAFDEWFPVENTHPSLAEAMGGDDTNRRLYFELCWESLTDGFLPVELALAQMPSKFEAKGRHFQLEYKPLLDGEELRNVLLVVTDVTAEVERIAEERRQRELIHLFQRLTKDRAGFLEFFCEAERLLHGILAEGRTDRAVLMREIHTLKGNAGMFGATSIAAVCHQVEESMGDEERMPNQEERAALRNTWQDFAERVRSLLGEQDDEILEIAAQELRAIIYRARGGSSTQELLAMLEELTQESMRMRFERIGHQITGLAKRLGKCEVVVTAEHNHLRLPADRWAPFWAAFAHLVRNAVDHGLETPDERAASDKPGIARIRLRAEKSGGNIVVELQDDGRGIDWETIREKAQAAGLPHESYADLVSALFHDGLSSRQEASDISGRGVGMSAVRDACKALGGRLKVGSEKGKGTTVRAVVPATASEPLSASLCAGTRRSVEPIGTIAEQDRRAATGT